MVSWFRRRRRQGDAPRLTPRGEDRGSVRAASGSIPTLAPDRRTYLGRAAYLQLVSYQLLSRALEAVDSLVVKEAVSLAAAQSLARHHGLTAELVQMRADPVLEMEKHTAELDAYAERIAGATWPETLLSVYLGDGMLNDLFTMLAPGLGADGERYAGLLAGDDSRTVLVEALGTAIEQEPGLASILAMWGRRLAGDAILVARGTLRLPTESEQRELLAAAAIAELVGPHTRRMDALGLTA